MPRIKGSGAMGTVRALRLPRALDQWFEERLCDGRNQSASELLLELIHGGLRLTPGYMQRHAETLKSLRAQTDRKAADSYVLALRQTFGERYVEHLIAWLAEGESSPSYRKQ